MCRITRWARTFSQIRTAPRRNCWRTYLCSIVSGVEPRTFWYDFRNDGDDPIYFEHNMGILTRELQPKPAYLAFGTLTRVLKGLRFAGPANVTASAETFAFRFLPDPHAEGARRSRTGGRAGSRYRPRYRGSPHWQPRRWPLSGGVRNRFLNWNRS
jgi:hypothetical protein